MESNSSLTESPKHASLSVTNDVQNGESFTYMVVAGVVQKIPVNTRPPAKPHREASPVRMRNKLLTFRTKPGEGLQCLVVKIPLLQWDSSCRRLSQDRRISCKDLGQGDCQGWLFKRKQKGATLSRRWEKRWCVLKHYSLYCYRDPHDLKAEGIIHLQAFQVSPAASISNRKFAFKIHNSGTTFYFASERQSDMGKWMNKIGLAAISYDASHDTTTSGFSQPGSLPVLPRTHTDDYSDSEEEEDTHGTTALWSGSVQSLASISSVDSTSSMMCAVSRHPHTSNEIEVLHRMISCIHDNDLTIDGKDKIHHRQSQCTVSQQLPAVINRTQVDKLRQMLSLQRTLQARELELQEIEDLLKEPVSMTELSRFVERHNLQPEVMDTHL